ncbi:MAG: 50S ribosomal protein L6 [Phycisphaerales bacterium]|nr:50S ribosomal protein L6 [Phycisphaerales bacterium]
MSRIGKQSIAVPATVKVAVNPASRTVSLTGPKGSNSFTHQPQIRVAWDDASKLIACTLDDPAKIDEGNRRALWGTTRAVLNKMVAGVATGYSKRLEVIGVGWTAKMQGKKLMLTIGFCHPIELVIPSTVIVTIENNTIITIAGVDAQQVGAFASLIRSQRKPEPYNGKGIKYSDEFIQRKKGKAFGA